MVVINISWFKDLPPYTFEIVEPGHSKYIACRYTVDCRVNLFLMKKCIVVQSVLVKVVVVISLMMRSFVQSRNACPLQILDGSMELS